MHHITSLSKLDYGPAAARPPDLPALLFSLPPLASTRLDSTLTLRCTALRCAALANCCRPLRAPASCCCTYNLSPHTTVHYTTLYENIVEYTSDRPTPSYALECAALYSSRIVCERAHPAFAPSEVPSVLVRWPVECRANSTARPEPSSSQSLSDASRSRVVGTELHEIKSHALKQSRSSTGKPQNEAESRGKSATQITFTLRVRTEFQI